jgi:cytochrome c peroxidase
MEYRLLCCIALLLATSVAGAAPFPKGDPKTGKALFDKAKCDACHASLMSGDGNKMFTRADRKMKSADALLRQVQFCAAQVGAQWFADEEQHVASYLNQQFYKFP